jgi:general secretion pathway protein I
MRLLNRQCGMTLLEVMIALSIFSVAAMSILNSVAVQINHLPEIEDQTIARWAAENQLVESFLTKPKSGSMNGELKEHLWGRNFFWETKVEAQESGVIKITTSIARDMNMKETLVSLSYYDSL